MHTLVSYPLHCHGKGSTIYQIYSIMKSNIANQHNKKHTKKLLCNINCKKRLQMREDLSVNVNNRHE